jgi:hypothetical protein
MSVIADNPLRFVTVSSKTNRLVLHISGIMHDNHIPDGGKMV